MFILLLLFFSFCSYYLNLVKKNYLIALTNLMFKNRLEMEANKLNIKNLGIIVLTLFIGVSSWFLMNYLISSDFSSIKFSTKKTPEISDSKYGITQFISGDGSYISSSNFDKSTIEGLNQISEVVRYALNKENQLFSYQLTSVGEWDDYSLEVKEVLPKKEILDRLFIVENTLYAYSKSKSLYKEVKNEQSFSLILEDVKLNIPSSDENESDIPKFNNASALDVSGNLYAWGDNRMGQLGNGEWGGVNPEVDPLLIMGNVKSYAIAEENSYYRGVALTNNHELYVWGMLPMVTTTEDMTTDWSVNQTNEESFQMDDMEVQTVNPNQTSIEPVLMGYDIKRYEVREDGVLATTLEGQEYLINGDASSDQSEN